MPGRARGRGRLLTRAARVRLLTRAVLTGVARIVPAWATRVFERAGHLVPVRRRGVHGARTRNRAEAGSMGTGFFASLRQHPRGFWFVFWGELAERASFYGMRTVLALYLVDELRFGEAGA